MLEIRELVIKAVINEDKALNNPNTPTAISAVKIAEQVEAAIRQTKER